MAVLNAYRAFKQGLAGLKSLFILPHINRVAPSETLLLGWCLIIYWKTNIEENDNMELGTTETSVCFIGDKPVIEYIKLIKDVPENLPLIQKKKEHYIGRHAWVG